MSRCKRLCALLLAGLLLCTACAAPVKRPEPSSTPESSTPTAGLDWLTVDTVPPFSGTAYVVLGDNRPLFKEWELTTVSYEKYAPLDALGRCGVTEACVGLDMMPTEDRGSIGQVKPTGWHTVKYDCVDGKYLYNRCHLIGYQLTGENANVCNLITGTRYLNIEGMLPFENMVADYVKETGNHVMYRVTPVLAGDNQLGSGVVMEGWSVEDDGEGVCFSVYAYNAQPGVAIDYATGESGLAAEGVPTTTTTATPKITFILNVNSKKFHLPTCGQAADIKASNRQETDKSRDELLDEVYTPCKSCKP